MPDSVILGLHGFSSHSRREMHDSGVCLLLNGDVAAAIDEERLTRRKRDGSFPINALDTALKMAGMNRADITDVAFVDKRTPWQTMQVLRYALSAFWQTGVRPWRYLAFWAGQMLNYRRTLPERMQPRRVCFYEHHLCHAASAYYPGPRPNATIVSLDGMGDFSIGGMVASGSGGKITVLNRSNGYFSPGHFYMVLTEYLGFTPGLHEGKITGLAAYGNPAPALAAMERVIRYKRGKLDFVAPLVAEEFFNVIRGGAGKRTSHWYSTRQPAARTSARDIRAIPGELKQFKQLWAPFSGRDIAAAGQAQFEKIICAYISDAVKLTGCPNVAVAGGCFANVRLNQRIRELPEVEDIYIHPNMGDGGLSTGAALLHYHRHGTRRNYAHKPWKNIYLGPSYPRADMESALREGGQEFLEPGDIAAAIAECLAAGKVVAWFQGGMEYGPRALGGRSLLAEATNPALPDMLNKRLGRSEFMPFAPVILREFAGDWLSGWDERHAASRFMTATYNVKANKKIRIPAVVHIDGTARPQVLEESVNPDLHAVMRQYYHLTGIPVLINTSFNMHDEPIVCSPADAVNAFCRGAGDVLAMGPFCVFRKRKI